MQRYKKSLVLFFVLALIVTGCAKKSTQQASISSGTGTGFDSLSSSDELAQLPQAAAGNLNQQGGVETLPVETSPVTQGASLGSAETASSGALNHEQKIQTALKNAGIYNGTIDGKLGPASKRAIQSFQKSNGLKADGKVGAKTWAALEPYLNGRLPPAQTSAAPAAASSGAATASSDSQ
jgi:peptidoglycan hydrolase-like protein with peptidoglycan-binding domain